MNKGLVLSGGGMRGIAHIGAIKALEENGYFPTHIAGTSAGAIVGALYAKGYNPTEILDFFKTAQIFNFANFALNKPGFIDSEKLYASFKSYLPEDTFESLKKYLFITATNLLDGKLEIFENGELIKAILASAAFPGVFTPVKFNDKTYIDGGTINNFPVDILKDKCDQIVGVYLSPFQILETNNLKYSFSILERAFQIKSASISMKKFSDCDLVIFPRDLSNYGTFYVKNADAIFDLGYETAQKAIQSKMDVLNLN